MTIPTKVGASGLAAGVGEGGPEKIKTNHGSLLQLWRSTFEIPFRFPRVGALPAKCLLLSIEAVSASFGVLFLVRAQRGEAGPSESF